jgi:Protein of unknown function (DUF3349)
MPLSQVMTSILGWLKTGYPEGVPATDYIPLFALGTQLTDNEVHASADELEQESDPQSATAIKKAITDVMSMEPNEIDVARVRARLAAGGWPLARPELGPPSGFGSTLDRPRASRWRTGRPGTGGSTLDRPRASRQRTRRPGTGGSTLDRPRASRRRTGRPGRAA